MTCLFLSGNGVVLDVKVVPNASCDKLDGILGDKLKIRLQAPPVEGKANKALVRFLAKSLNISKSDVVLLSGETSRTKRIMLRGISLDTAVKTLTPPPGP